MRRSVPTTFFLVALLALLPTSSALGSTTAIGNPAVLRDHADGFTNFTIVDTNHPAASDGHISSIDFYAHRAGTVRFVLVDDSGAVTWLSDEVTAGSAGFKTADLGGPISISAGSNLGVYSKGAGVVSYGLADDAAPANYTPNNAGQPTVGETLVFAGTTTRFYSMTAEITAVTPEEPPAPEEPPSSVSCKKGGWESMGYRNQGQCVSAMKANEHAAKS